MPELPEPLAANRALWDAWTELHTGGGHYDVEGFVRGGVRIDPVVREEVGDVQGRRLLHLQCHFGLDTLSWARLGAEVTGADFSPASIAAARALAARCELPAAFVESEVKALPQNLQGSFDVVYTSHGVIGWLPDLRPWARVIAHFLTPGGFFYIAEGHPAGLMFDENMTDTLRVGYPYFSHAEPIVHMEEGSYAEPGAEFRGASYGWSHPFSEIVGALLDAGLRIEFLHEFPFTVWQMLPCLRRAAGDRYWRMPADMPQIPLMFSLKASRPTA